MLDDERALRADPADASAMVDRLNASIVEAEFSIARLQGLVDGYERAHRGPDIDVVVGGGRVAIDGLRSLVDGVVAARDAFRAAERRLGDLLAESDRLRTEIVGIARLAPPDPAAIEAELTRRFDAIRAREDSIHRDLARDLDAISLGPAPVFDSAAITVASSRTVSRPGGRRPFVGRGPADLSRSLGAELPAGGDPSSGPAGLPRTGLTADDLPPLLGTPALDDPSVSPIAEHRPDGGPPPPGGDLVGGASPPLGPSGWWTLFGSGAAMSTAGPEARPLINVPDARPDEPLINIPDPERGESLITTPSAIGPEWLITPLPPLGGTSEITVPPDDPGVERLAALRYLPAVDPVGAVSDRDRGRLPAGLELRLLDPAHPAVLRNALRSFRSTRVTGPDNTALVISRSDMSRILQRHHPRFWNPAITSTGRPRDNNTSLDGSLSPDAVLGLLLDVLQTGTSTNQPDGDGILVHKRVDGIDYEVGFRLSDGHVQHFTSRREPVD